MSMARSASSSIEDDTESTSSAGASSFLSRERAAFGRTRGRLQAQGCIGEVDLFSRLEAAETRLVLETRQAPNMGRSQVSKDRDFATKDSDPVTHTGTSVSAPRLNTAANPSRSSHSDSCTSSKRAKSTTNSSREDNPLLYNEEMRNERLLMQLQEQEAATLRARDDSAEATADLKAAVLAKADMQQNLTSSRDQEDDLRDQIAGLKALQALQHNIIEKQATEVQDKKNEMDEKLKLQSSSDSAQRERAELMKEAFALVSSSVDLPRRQAAMKIIAEVRAAEHILQDATTRLGLLLQGIVQPGSNKDSASMKAQALPQNRVSGSTTKLRASLPQNLISMRLDSISEEALETQSTTSVNVNEAASSSSAVGDVDGGPEEAPSQNPTDLVMAAVAQQLREHSHEVSVARQQALEATEKNDQDLAKQKSDAREKHVEMVEALAMAQSKANRLEGKLKNKDETLEQQALEAKDYQSRLQSNDKARLEAETKLEELTEALKKRQNPQHENHQHKQLLAAVESSKLACGRAEDFRLEIESLKARHAREVETLERELNIVRTAQTSAGDQSGSASLLLDVQEQVRHLTEERNELQNTLEWQEIQWRSKVEDLEMQLVMQSSAAAA